MPLSSSRIQEIFNNLSSPDTSSKYWDHVSPTVNWTVIGSTPISGVVNIHILRPSTKAPPAHLHLAPTNQPHPFLTRHQYNSKQVFREATVAYLGRDILTGPLRMQPINVIASPASPGKTSAAVEMQAVDAECRNGLKYEMRVGLVQPRSFPLICTDGAARRIVLLGLHL